MSTAFISPIFPSWIRSRNGIPRPTYFLAMLTTRRRLASVSCFFASSSPASTRFASSTSCSVVSSGTFPISFRYIRTGSSVLTPSSTSTSSMISTSSSSSRMISSLSRIRSSALSTPTSAFTISIFCFSRYSSTRSILSSVSSSPLKASLISPYCKTFFFVFAKSTSPSNAFVNCSCCNSSILQFLLMLLPSGNSFCCI